MFAAIAQQLAADKADAGKVLGSIVSIGSPGKEDPQSGAILKVLSGVDGFMTRVTEGVKNGHSYRVIHVPGKTEFILEDSYMGMGGKKETRRQIFKIISEPKIAPSDDWSRFKPNIDDERELASESFSLLDEIETGLDDIINSVKS